MSLRFGVLGPLRVVADKAEIPVRSGKQRVLLAALLLRANRVVPTEELIRFLWPEDPPAGATQTVHTYVTRLRKVLGDRDLIGAVPDGFLIRLPAGALDVEDFERFARQGLREAARGNRDAAETAYTAALDLWRGDLLADVPSKTLLSSAKPVADSRVRVLDRLKELHEPREPAFVYHRPRQLPPDQPGFVGRAGLLDQLSRGDTVLLSGPPGVGKTALAVRHGQSLSSVDGELYVNMRGFGPGEPLTPDDAIAHVLRSIGLPPEQIPTEPDDLAARYRELLGKRVLLVVLDNIASAEQVRPLLFDGPRFVLISRNTLPELEGVRRIEVPQLSAPESFALFTHMLGADLVTAQASAVGELAELCGHFPLALRIAAAQMFRWDEPDVAWFVRQLREEDRLGGLEIVNDSQAAVRTAFASSYRALSAEGARLFRMLGVLPGTDFSVDAVATLIDDSASAARASLETLVQASLLQRWADDRYHFHDLLRVYAAERAESDDDSARWRERLHAWYLSSTLAAVNTVFPEAQETRKDSVAAGLTFADDRLASAWLAAETANIVAVVETAAEQGDEIAWRLAKAVAPFLRSHRLVSERHATCEAGLLVAQRTGNREAEAAMLHSLAGLNWSLADYTSAIDEYGRALAVHQELGNLRGQASTLGNLGGAYYDAGRLHLAFDVLTRALAAHREVGSAYGEAATLINLGSVCADSRSVPEALAHFERSFELWRQVGSHVGEVVCLSSLSQMSLAAGDLALALDFADRGVQLCEQTGNVGSQARTLLVRSEALLTLGRLDGAEDDSRTALLICRETSDRKQEAEALTLLAEHALARVEPEDAREFATGALAIATGAGYLLGRCDALAALSQVDLADGDLAAALEHARTAHELAERTGYRRELGRVLVTMAKAHRALGEHGAALHRAREAVELNRSFGQRLELARSLLVLGGLRGGADGARDLAEGHALLSDIGLPAGSGR
ncbi:ATP-binding protein [Allokutzneria albata]|uniref:Transcriptional activator domain-containing protein n=1 Tax=Allokutzneria albata TaxID=211114 RepID=A0A1G9YKX5_ALLAB|nr:tetratricopeptide repeat protein [Allokutzneria albata]SDN09602.1 transcriptional activator domain-containing protein [Allokutzneria albata]